MAQRQLRSACVLLAAGQGRRAGGPKALKLTGDGTVWWLAQARRIAQDIDTVVPVLHPHAWPLPAGVAPEIVPCRGDPDATLLRSLQLGLAALQQSGRVDHVVLVLPVDCPWPGPQVFGKLWSAICNSGARWDAVIAAVQTDRGLQRGHPVLLMPRVTAAIMQLNPQVDRIDHWLAAPDRVIGLVDVGDLAILANHNLDGITS